MKKIFIVTGEISGDNLAAWYVQKHGGLLPVYYEAIGGHSLQELGITLYERLETLNVVGIVEIARHLPFILSFLNKLTQYIIDHGFDEVLLVDFPGFNLRLAKLLKNKKPNLKITYLSPPQLWCWGAWRIKKLKKYCDDIIVLYPFEVAWYQKRGLRVRWLGSPVYDRLQPYLQSPAKKQPCIALLVASRRSELETLFPLGAQVIKTLGEKFPEISFVIPLASSLSIEHVEQKIVQAGLCAYRSRIKILQDEDEKMRALAMCCAAITKPGTITLELALLGIPSVVFFKTSWLTYWLARPLVKIKYMSLPNLLLPHPVYKEFIQQDCVPARIVDEVEKLYQSFLMHDAYYEHAQKGLQEIKQVLSGL